MARVATWPATLTSHRIPPRWSIPLFLALLVAIGLVTAYTMGYIGQRATAPSFQTSAVTRGDIRSTISATGPITNPASLPLTFKSSGKLVDLRVQTGDRVTAGQVLALLDSSDLEANLAQAQAQLMQAQANYDKLAAGPTAEDIAVAQAQVAASEQGLASAQRGLATTQATAAQQAQVSAASVESAQVSLANAQKVDENTRAQVEASATSLNVSLENGRKALENAKAQAASAILASEATLAADQKSLEEAEKNLAIVRTQIDRDTQGDRIAVQNAEVVVRNAQTALSNAERKAKADLDVAQRQVERSKSDLRTQETQRDQDCKSTSSSSGSTTSSNNNCNVAKRQVDSSRASLKTTEQQVEVTRVSGQQSIATAQASLNTANSSLNTAQAALSSNQAKYAGSLQTAQAQVETAKSRVNSSQASLEDAKTRQQASIVTAQNSLDAAQATFDESTSKNQATLVTSRNSIDSAQASLQSAIASQGQSRASSADSVEGARSQVEQAAASLNTARASSDAATAMPTDFELQASQAQVENARAAASIAENNFKQATLITPVDGIVASVSASVGQYISGGAVNSGNSATSSTTAGTAVAGFITLTNVSEPQVSAQVSEADVGRVRPGQTVNFTVSAFPGRTFTGKVARIDPFGTTTSNVVNYNVVSVVDKPDVELLPSMTATVTIITEQVTNVLLVPNTAVSYGLSQASRLPQVDESGAAASDSAPGTQSSTSRGSGARAGGAEIGAGQGANRGAGARAGSEAGAAAGTEGSTDAASGRQFGGNRTGGTRADTANRDASTVEAQSGTPGFLVVLQNGEPVARRVRLGSRDDRNTQVISGLQVGDQIVIGQTTQAQQSATPKPTTGGSGLLPGGPGGGGAVQKR